MKIHSKPIRWVNDHREFNIEYVILAARWQGTRIEPGIANLPVGIAYVTNNALIQDDRLDFAKCAYVAIGVPTDTSGSRSRIRTD